MTRPYNKKKTVPNNHPVHNHIARKSDASAITEKAMQAVFELPDFIRSMGKSRSDSSKEIIKMAELVKMLGKNPITGMPDAVILTKKEFNDRFPHKNEKTHEVYFKKQLKIYGISNPKLVKHEEKVYIWKEEKEEIEVGV